jgi:hypothetical protein
VSNQFFQPFNRISYDIIHYAATGIEHGALQRFDNAVNVLYRELGVCRVVSWVCLVDCHTALSSLRLKRHSSAKKFISQINATSISASKASVAVFLHTLNPPLQ